MTSKADPQTSPEMQARVFVDSVQAMVKPIRDSNVSLIVVVLVFAWAIWRNHPWPQVAVWVALTVAVQFVPGFAYVALRRAKRSAAGRMTEVARARSLARFLVFAGGFTGLWWGVSVLWFADPAKPEMQFAIALTIGGLSAANMAAQAFYPAMVRTYLILMNLPFIAWGFAQSHLQQAFLPAFISTGMFMLMLHLLYFGSLHTRTLRKNIELRHENTRLVAGLQAQKTELEAANQAKSQFFAAASHDLRQPLQALGYYSSLLKPHAADAPFVQRIQQCVDSLDGLLEGVLSISRLDAGKVQRLMDAHDLGALLRRLCALYEGVAQAKGLTLALRATTQSASHWGHTDAVLLERVLGNLLSNAVRYTQAGGILVTLRRSRGNWRIQVADSGPGIATEHLETVFDEFVQLGNPERDADQGVGLGLATARRIALLLEHPLTVRSRLGHGSVFSVSIPHTAPVARPVASSLAATSAHINGRVLVVEDNLLVRESLVQTLAGWGLAVVACENAASAVACFTESPAPFDLVLSDWRLPGSVNGLGLFDQLRQTSRRLPSLVLMTGEAEFSVGQVPADVVLLKKPLRPLQLRSVLAAKLG